MERLCEAFAPPGGRELLQLLLQLLPSPPCLCALGDNLSLVLKTIKRAGQAKDIFFFLQERTCCCHPKRHPSLAYWLRLCVCIYMTASLSACVS